MDILDQLGLNTEQCIDDIKNRAAALLVAELSKAILSDVTKKATQIIDQTVQAKVVAVVEETLKGEYQPIDDYGEPKGPKTTLRDMIKSRAVDWWQMMVDKDGSTAKGYYGNTTRGEYMAKKVLSGILENSIKGDLYKLVEASKEAVRESISKTINEAVTRVWGATK